MNNKYRNPYTEEQIQFLKDNVKGITLKELTERFNKRFNQQRTLSSIRNQKNKYGLKSGIVGGRFEKGQTPFNKGKKWDEFMSEEAQKNSLKTTFKKGNTPPNRREIFEERISKDGYIEMKIQDGKGNDNWAYKHRYIWEQANGAIPKDHIVIFADGDKTNLEIDNLILISKRENAILNKRGLRYDNKETTELGITLANLILKTSEIKRGD